MTQQLYITKQDIDAIGIVVPEVQEDTFLTHVNETLQKRIGTEISNNLDDSQIDEMLSVQESNDDEKLQDWLKTNVPELTTIVQDEIDILLGELVDSTESINS